MILYISHSFFDYEAGNLCRLFFPYEKLKTVTDLNEAKDDNFIVKALYNEETTTVSVIKDNTASEKIYKNDNNKDKEYNVTSAIYKSFCEFCSYYPSWGMLTGIHPVKLFIEHIDKFGKVEAERIFKEEYFVSEEKLGICRKIASVQKPSTDKLEDNDFSLYISIPFCPSRCSYCSFVSTSIRTAGHLMQGYVDNLCQDIRYTAKKAKETGLNLKTIYMGGGTPTAITAAMLEQVMKTVQECFDLSKVEEYTVEAGRPDCTDIEKLQIIKKYGANRVSINPQTFSDNVLKAIGRNHSHADFLRCVEDARKVGFESINMDLIAGLPKDDFDGFKRSLDAVAALDPANITVHTLALKKGSRLMEQGAALPSGEETARMLDYSLERLSGKGYLPYYLYRQKYMSGSLENVGWCLSGQESVYNIVMMEELQTVVSIGGGGVTKLVDRAAGTIVRQPNPKYPHDYLAALDRVLAQKEELAACFLPTHN